jgi:hypothetical protein
MTYLEMIREKPLIQRLWDNKGIRIGVQVLLVVIFSALTAIAKKMHPSLEIPGSSAIYWLTVMLIGRSVMRWPGSGVLTGIGVGLWSVPIGLEHTMSYDMALYAVSGLMMDVMLFIPRINLKNPFGAIICGLMAHMVKYGFIVSTAIVSSSTRHFLVVGLINSALLHAAFGIGAGLLAWIMVKIREKAYNRFSNFFMK